eukprot:g56153.t1
MHHIPTLSKCDSHCPGTGPHSGGVVLFRRATRSIPTSASTTINLWPPRSGWPMRKDKCNPFAGFHGKKD